MAFRRSFSSTIFGVQPKGTLGTFAYRVYLTNKSTSTLHDLSFWHSIPLKPLLEGSSANLFHYVNEIPYATHKKMEICTTEKDNPIKQDVKKGELRVFTYGPIPFNYGCLPQTWEDPMWIEPSTQVGGDSDPIDVVEISNAKLEIGEVDVVKVLGILALLDEGETDWKVVAISKKSELFSKLNHIEDVDLHLPGMLHTIREWFRLYKTADGKPENKFGLDEKFMNADFAIRVINETHHAWKRLLTSKTETKFWKPKIF